MANFLQDVRYGLRMLVKSPGFTAVALISLALGIGANTTIFTLAKGIFLQSIPVKNAGRVVVLYSNQMSRKGPPQEYLPTPYLNAVDYCEDIRSFSGCSIVMPDGFDLTESGRRTRVQAQLVNANYFDLLGIHPILGRSFSPEDESSVRPVAVISYSLWNTRFGADRGIIGRSVQLDQMEYSVIGVAPAGFRGLALGSPDVWIPVSLADEVLSPQAKDFMHDRSFRMVRMVARLKPGVALAQAQAEVHALGLQRKSNIPRSTVAGMKS